MHFLFNLNIINILISALAIFLVLLVAYYKWCFTYWKRRNVPITHEPTIPFGTALRRLLNKPQHLGLHFMENYNLVKACNYKYSGEYVFTIPKCVIIDPEYIKNVLQKDFEYFSAREFYYNENDDPLSANLFAISGEKWRMLRSQLSPAFTAGKIKIMFDNLLQCSTQMVDMVSECCKNRDVLDIQDVAQAFTIDVIGSCAFGIECNSFKNPNAEFKIQGKKAFYMTRMRIFKIFIGSTCPRLARYLGITLFDKEANDFFINMVKETIEFRERNNIHRKDILQLLMDLKAAQLLRGQDNILTLDEMTAQVFIFFAAGFETSAITMTFCLYELALAPKIQEKLRNEIDNVLELYNGSITYEAIMDLKYMGQVIDETLRKYPPVAFVTRRCVKDYTMPDANNFKIEKGIEVIIPIMGLHRDPEYYPEPEKFIPERFSDEEKHKHQPYTYLPFGEGPRICIGKRFGLLQTKVGLVKLLQRFRFSLNKKTSVPLEIEPYSFTLIPKSGVFLDVHEIN